MEELLHYVWKHKLFQKDLRTTDGTAVEVIDAGIHNTDGGPDFFNAKIKLGDKTWAGNVEIHKRSSDWKRHKHHEDKTYNSVVLHVVEDANEDVYTESGQKLIQCQISCPKHIKENIEYLLYAHEQMPCCNYINSMPDVHLSGWINTLLVERLERKASDIERLLTRFNNSWDEVFYVLLARSFGFGLNSDSFEQLALSLPFIALQKQRNDIEQIEALMFGQAGMLGDDIKDDDYSRKLKNEYGLLKNKYSLSPLESYIFKKLRMRPGSSPHIRIAQLAMLLFKEDRLFSKIAECGDVGKIRLMLHENASEYWQTHYCFGEPSPRKSKFIGDASLDVIIINAVVPILFSYGKHTGNDELCERAFMFLDTIKAESNSIVRSFTQYGLKVSNAGQSQAVIQLKREYCQKRKCLFCRIGYQILTEK
ncbi:hypothetical protein M2132_002172 [Dysgonomonas sp. PH5-45]|uniref:DUF2851 family protein n=1 Tax=unclassified Dysgonomonas TaxID=2630389 RepID=UPI00247378B0|nr:MULTISPECIES: DUF2851 family protein [unclassified Dysgonomonas]MDH6355825.1 hypothetical protein [Dysgonomonas sp. PH5-45]MDH6388708.1 hypothetical protein [Dysgonomonas sp. PH5-37]